MRSWIVARQITDCHAPEHHAGTPLVLSLKLVLSRLASRGRSKAACVARHSVACFHAKLDHASEVSKAFPKEPRLHDWYVARREDGSGSWSKPCRAWPATQGATPCAVSTATTSFRKASLPALEKVDQTIVDCFQAKIMSRVGPCEDGEGTVLRRVLVWNETGFFLQPDPKHFQNLEELLEV